MISLKTLGNGLRALLSMNSREIFTGVEIASAFFGVVSAFKAGWDICNEMEEPSLDEFFKKKLWIKLILPGGAVAICTVSAVVQYNSVGRLLATTASIVALKNQENSDLKDAMNKVLKKGDVEKVNQEKAKTTLDRHPQPDEAFIKKTGNGNDLFYDPMTDTYFRSSMEAVKSAINDINSEDVLNGIGISWGEVCEKLGFSAGKLADYIYIHPQSDPSFNFEQLVIDTSQAHVTNKGEAAVILDCQNELNSDFFRPGPC